MDKNQNNVGLILGSKSSLRIGPSLLIPKGPKEPQLSKITLNSNTLPRIKCAIKQLKISDL